MFKARNAMTEHKLKPWQEVERRQPRELKHKIKEANEHKLECKPEHKANNRDQNKTSDTFRHFNFKLYILQDQHILHRQECDGGIKLI
jgi:hypothetical protein